MFSFEAGPTFSQTKQLLDLWNIDQSNGYSLFGLFFCITLNFLS